MSNIDTELLASYAFLEALEANEKAEEALNRPHGRGATYLPKHLHTAAEITGLTAELDDDYVNVSGDTMTGNLTITNAGPSLTFLETGSATSMTMTQTANYFSFIDSVMGGPVLDFDSLTNAPEGLVTLYGDFGSNLTPYLPSTYYVGTPGSEWLNGYFNIIEVGTANAGAAITFDTDDKSDIGTAATQARNIYVDGIAYIDNLSLDTTDGLGISTTTKPTADDSLDLGGVNREWKDLYLDGWAYIDSLRVDVALNCEAIDVVAAVGGNQTAKIPVTANGTTMYIPLYTA